MMSLMHFRRKYVKNHSPGGRHVARERGALIREPNPEIDQDLQPEIKFLWHIINSTEKAYKMKRHVVTIKKA